MTTRRIFAMALICAALNMGLPAYAQDAPAKKSADLSLSVDMALNQQRDKTNYIHYFLWLILDNKDLNVASKTPCTGEKWMAGKLKKAGKTAITSDVAKDYAAKLSVDVKVVVGYRPIKFKYDGAEETKGHQWVGTIVGSVKDASGKVVRKFDLKHTWGTNELTSRSKGRVAYMRQMAEWIAIELFQTKEVLAQVPEAKKANVDSDMKKFMADKKQFYDPDTGDAPKGIEEKKDASKNGKKSP